MAQLSKLTDAELRKIAESHGITWEASQSKKEIIELITAAELAAAPAPDEVPESQETTLIDENSAPLQTREKKFRIIVHNQDGVDSSPFIKVGVNDVVYQIAREREVVVPEAVKHVLENAVITRYEDAPDGRSKVEVQARRFPFTVLGEV